MPKVIVSGRGGSGKSTATTLLSQRLAMEGPVLVVDADESNLGLPLMLGIEAPAETVMEYLGGRSFVSGALMDAMVSRGDERVSFFDGGIDVERLPAACKSSNGAGIVLVRVGKVEHALEGCACPEGAVARAFLAGLTCDDDWVLVDTEAGIEHFGRGLLEGADLVLIVVDASHEAVLLAEKAAGLAGEAGKPCAVVLNQADAEVEAILRAELRARGVEVLGSLSRSPAVAQAQLLGAPLSLSDDMQESLDGLHGALIATLKQSRQLT
jgi:CO dehydrogenase maturation factor